MLGNTQQPVKRNLSLVLVLCLASFFAPLWTGLPASTPEETPVGGLHAPLVRMLEPDSRLTLSQQRLPKGVLPHIFRRAALPMPELTWNSMPRVQVLLPTIKLFMVFARWSLEGG